MWSLNGIESVDLSLAPFFPSYGVSNQPPDLAFQSTSGGRDARFTGYFCLEAGDSDGTLQGKGKTADSNHNLVVL